MTGVAGPNRHEMPARFACSDGSVVTRLALTLNNALMAELRWLPGQGAVATIASHGRLQVFGRHALGRLPVVAGLALPGQHACVAEYLLLTRQDLQSKAGVGHDTLIDRI